MRVQIDEVLEFSVDNPLNCRVAVFELDAEDGVTIVERIQRIRDTKFCVKMMR